MMDSREHLHDKGTFVLTASMLSDEYLLFTHSISVPTASTCSVESIAGQEGPTASAAASEASTAADALEQTAETPVEGETAAACLNTMTACHYTDQAFTLLIFS